MKNFLGLGIVGELVGCCDDQGRHWTAVHLKSYLLCWIWNFDIRISRKRDYDF